MAFWAWILALESWCKRTLPVSQFVNGDTITYYDCKCKDFNDAISTNTLGALYKIMCGHFPGKLKMSENMKFIGEVSGN